MKAISIKPHWAWLVVNGHKDIENRTWQAESRNPGPGAFTAAGILAGNPSIDGPGC